MADHQSKCQHRDASVARAYFDANGRHRVRHAYAYCGRRDGLAVDVYGYAYCPDHRSSGDYGHAADVDLDAVLESLRRQR